MSQPSYQALLLGKIKSAYGLLSTANANRDGTGTIVDVFVADAAYGSLVERVSLASAGAIGVASSDNVIRMWRKQASTYRLIREFTIKGATPSATLAGGSSASTAPAVPSAGAAQAPDPFIVVNQRLAAGDTLSFSIHTVAGTQDNYHVQTEGGDYAAA